LIAESHQIVIFIVGWRYLSRRIHIRCTVSLPVDHEMDAVVYRINTWHGSWAMTTLTAVRDTVEKR
jgi:hypothetical protein